MSNSTTLLDLLTANQSGKETTANSLFDAASPTTLYGRRASTTSGLTWGYYGGFALIGGTLTTIANGTVSLTASQTNYVEANPTTGAVSANTTAYTPGYIRLYTIVAGASTVTSYTDHRVPLAGMQSERAAVSMTSDANITLSAAQAAARILDVTSTVSLTATRNVVVPLTGWWILYNGTTGAQSLQVIGATGTGTTIANAKRAIVYGDGTNIVRATADV